MRAAGVGGANTGPYCQKKKKKRAGGGGREVRGQQPDPADGFPPATAPAAVPRSCCSCSSCWARSSGRQSAAPSRRVAAAHRTAETCHSVSTVAAASCSSRVCTPHPRHTNENQGKRVRPLRRGGKRRTDQRGERRVLQVLGRLDRIDMLARHLGKRGTRSCRQAEVPHTGVSAGARTATGRDRRAGAPPRPVSGTTTTPRACVSRTVPASRYVAATSPWCRW